MNPDRWRKIQDLFHAAEEVEPQRRAGFLEEACGGDLSLKAQVETLLVANEEEWLQSAVGKAAVEMTAAAPSRIGRYRILRTLGEGGMGIVYEAEQEHPKRRVALKVIRAGHFAGERMRRLFQREAEVLGRLKHPGIATIYESGVTEDGQPFLVMELVTGTPLEDWLDRQERLRFLRREDVLPRLRMFLGICDAIQYAHQNGVIHRDLKPSNIFVLDEPGDSTLTMSMTSTASSRQLVKILDFGLARVNEGDGQGTVLTEAGMVQGSLPYMSPEQARGENDQVDVRTDIYALGVVLYRMLTGRHPYLENWSNFAQAVVQIDQAPPKPFRELAPKYDSDLETVLLKALEKDPRRRYQSVNAFSADLVRFASDLPVQARPPSTMYQLGKLVRRNRGVFAAIMALLVMLVAFSAVTFVQSRRIAAERDRARLEAATAKQVSDFLVDLFRKTNRAQTKGEMTAQDLLRTGKEELEKSQGFQNQPELRARLLDNIASAHNVIGPFEEAEKVLKESLAIRERLYGKDALESAGTWLHLSDTYYNMGRYPDSAKAAETAAAIREKRLGPMHGDLAAPLGSQADALALAGDLDRALAVMQRAVEIDRTSGNRESAGGAVRLQSLGNILRRREMYPEAIEALREAARLQAKYDGELSIAAPLNQLGMALNQSGRPAEGEAELRKCLAIIKKVYGESHPNVGMLGINIAYSLNAQKRYAEAERQLREADRILSAALPAGHPSFADMWEALGEAALGQGRHAEGLAIYRKAYEFNRSKLGPDAPRTLGSMVRLGGGEIEAGHVKEGRATLEAALRKLEALGLGASQNARKARAALGR